MKEQCNLNIPWGKNPLKLRVGIYKYFQVSCKKDYVIKFDRMHFTIESIVFRGNLILRQRKQCIVEKLLSGIKYN